MKIIAHRGASGEYPENTLLALDQAINQAADGIEFDVQYHQSGQFILLHDADLETSTNGKGHFSQLTLAQLQQLDAGQGQQIPTLQQALQQINGRCLVNIELKLISTDNQEMLKIILALHKMLSRAVAEQHFTWQQFIISSFNHPLLAEIKLLVPKLTTAALTASCPLNYAAFAQELKTFSINPAINMLTPNLVKDAHQRGLQVWAYTVDKKSDIQYCYDLAIDGIFTNYPAKSRHYLKQLCAS